jgi:hypothetical protein
VAEERNAAVLELRTLLLESESESIVGGSEMVYSVQSQKKAEKSEKGRDAHLDYTLLTSIRHSRLPSSRPGAPLSNWAHCLDLVGLSVKLHVLVGQSPTLVNGSLM